MSITVIREELTSCTPLGPVHTLDTVTAVFTTPALRIAEQVRLTSVVLYSGEVEGLTMMFSCRGKTDAKILIMIVYMICTSILLTFYWKNAICTCSQNITIYNNH